MKEKKIVMRNLESFLNRRKIKSIETWVRQQNFTEASDLEDFCKSQNIQFEVSKYLHLFSKNENQKLSPEVIANKLQESENSFAHKEAKLESLDPDEYSNSEAENTSGEEVSDLSSTLEVADTNQEKNELIDSSRKNLYKRNKKKN